MKRNILRYAMLVCLSALAVTVSCSESKSGETPEDPDKLTAITITPSPLTLTVGQTAQLTAKATPETASLEGLRWTPRDPKIADVSDDGLVTAVAVGTGTIVAKCGNITATCEVTVNKAPVALQKIELSVTLASIAKGKALDITAKLVPENAAAEGPVVWKSDDTSKATVDQNGRITGVADGRTVISATIGSVSASCDIEVYSPAAARDFTFLQLNLWEGIGNVSNGQEALIKQLAELKPDAASFCEFTSEDNARTILTAVAAELYKRTGIRYTYTCKGGSGTRGLLTRHQVLSTDPVNNNPWFYRTVIDFYGQQMALYASHAYHMYYACYLPRGYGDGSAPYDWNKLTDGPITDVKFILEREELSGRTQIAKDLTAETKTQQAQGRLCIFGGDLNQPSHLDWTEAMKDKYEHNGCVVAWPISTVCYADGMQDAYRTVYPDPVTHPAVTWPVSNKDARKETQWAAEADERDRIDFVYYRPDAKFAPKKAQILGPSAMISKSVIVEDQFVNKAEELIEPVGGVWPSDHRGLLITFEVKFP